MRALADVILIVAVIPFIYYFIVLYSAWRFFHGPLPPSSRTPFTPPVSNLKPVRGLDPGAYENFASFCRQDYPEFELLFCVSPGDPAGPVLEKLIRDFPDRQIRIILQDNASGINDKVNKLDILLREAKHEILVISDSDVRADPGYMRRVVAPLQDPKVGAVTHFYLPIEEKGFAESLQNIGMLSDFYAGVLVAKQLDGVKFALGPTIATRRKLIEGFGGYKAISNRPGDDLLVGRLIAEQGYEVQLPREPIFTVADFGSFRALLHKRMRWFIVMRHLRRWGHLGLFLTQGLPWSLAAVAVHPTAAALGYLGTYALLRCAITWSIGINGLKQRGVWSRMPLIVLWDALAFAMWLASFTQNTLHWRNKDYYLRNGELVPVDSD